MVAPGVSMPVRVLSVGVIGPGRVGSALLEQLRAAQPRLARDTGITLNLSGVIASKRMWLDCDDPQLNNRQNGAQTWRPGNIDEFTAHVCGNHKRHALLVDCTAHNEIVAYYPHWLASGIHVVTPNKLGLSGNLARWQSIRHACRSGTARLRYEATVCAGLPVIQTLRDLLDTGDRLISIQGMFSGTLAWLFNRHDGQQSFSSLLHEAHALGYTEPDPRADLSGMDVARKLVILAREAGLPLSLEHVEVESLIPPTLAGCPLDTFMQHTSTLDAPMNARLAQARSEDGVLRHVASLDCDGHARVQLRVLPSRHAFAHTQFTDNIVQFCTDRYRDNPLLVQGPGAGPEFTAGGVFADMLRIAESLTTCA